MRKWEPKLRSTKDYDLFDAHQHNRDEKRNKDLEASMRKYGFDPGCPIRVVRDPKTKKLRINKGHHRFNLARQLGEPIWFIEMDHELPLYEAEASEKSWTVPDFTASRARSGDNGAIAVKEFQRRTGLPVGVCISLIGGEGPGSSNKQRDMRTGSFVPGDQRYAEKIEMVVSACKNANVAFATNKLFVTAIYKALCVPEFDLDLFLHRMKSNVALMDRRSTTDGYLELIELIYNRQASLAKRLNVAYRAREVAKLRALTFGKPEMITKKAKKTPEA